MSLKLIFIPNVIVNLHFVEHNLRGYSRANDIRQNKNINKIKYFSSILIRVYGYTNEQSNFEIIFLFEIYNISD